MRTIVWEYLCKWWYTRLAASYNTRQSPHCSTCSSGVSSYLTNFVKTTHGLQLILYIYQFSINSWPTSKRRLRGKLSWE